MVKLGILNDVLRKFPATPRRPKYLDKLEYAHLPLERNSEIFLSSAYFADHWSYSAVQGAASMMLDDTKRFYVCGLPYQISVAEGLLSLEYVEEQMMDANFDMTMFLMEWACEWFGGGSDNSFFNINDIGKTRLLQYPMLPQAKLFDEFCCDWLVIDAKGAGVGIVDGLLREISDVDTGEIYPALSWRSTGSGSSCVSAPGCAKTAIPAWRITFGSPNRSRTNCSGEADARPSTPGGSRSLPRTDARVGVAE